MSVNNVYKGMRVMLNPVWEHKNWYSYQYLGKTGVVTAVCDDNSELPITVYFDNGGGQFVSKDDIEIAGGIGTRIILSPTPDRKYRYNKKFLGKTGTIIHICDDKDDDCTQFDAVAQFYNINNFDDKDDDCTQFDAVAQFYNINNFDDKYAQQHIHWCDCMILHDREININELSTLDLF